MRDNNADAGRQAEIEEFLAQHGFRMEHSLAIFDGAGHAIVRMNGEDIDEVDIPSEVIELAEEWVRLEEVGDLDSPSP